MYTRLFFKPDMAGLCTAKLNVGSERSRGNAIPEKRNDNTVRDAHVRSIDV